MRGKIVLNSLVIVTGCGVVYVLIVRRLVIARVVVRILMVMMVNRRIVIIIDRRHIALEPLLRHVVVNCHMSPVLYSLRKVSKVRPGPWPPLINRIVVISLVVDSCPPLLCELETKLPGVTTL